MSGNDWQSVAIKHDQYRSMPISTNQYQSVPIRTCSVKLKVDPSPYVDCTQICPPISSTSCLQIARPSPTPNGLRTLASWIFVNMPKSFFCAFSSIPIPVSRTPTKM